MDTLFSSRVCIVCGYKFIYWVAIISFDISGRFLVKSKKIRLGKKCYDCFSIVYKEEWAKKSDTDKEKCKEANRKWRERNRAKEKIRVAEYSKNNPEKRREQQKRYNSKPSAKLWLKEWVRTRKVEDSNFALACILRSRFSSALKGKKGAGDPINDLGCSVEFFHQYIESKFQLGMVQNNHGLGDNKWNYDHILPLSSFDLTDREQFLKAAHYINYQPLWTVDNLKKGSKILATLA